MRKKTFLELAKRILEETQQPLTTFEIWEVAKEKGYDKFMVSQGKTPWFTIGAQIYVNMRDKKNSPFFKIDSKPRRFYLQYLVKDGEDLGVIEKEPPDILKPKKLPYKEQDLHPFLAYFAFGYLNNVYTKTIRHSKSKKSSYGEWVHPDMVGCYFSFEQWKPEVADFSSTIGKNLVKLYSFEIKRELNFSNLRESFFQTVSNSSWANEGYLVSSEISNDEDFQSELSRLSSSFGIGLIKLDVENPDSSAVLYPVRYKEYVDWDTINKLSINADYREFLNRVKIDVQSKEIRKERYDKIIDTESLVKSLKKK